MYIIINFPHGNRPVEPCELWHVVAAYENMRNISPLLSAATAASVAVEQQAAQQRGVRDFSSFQGHLDWDTFGKILFWKYMLMTSYDNEQVIQVVEDALFEDSLGNRANNNILNFFLSCSWVRWKFGARCAYHIKDIVARNGGWFQGFPSSAAGTTARGRHPKIIHWLLHSTKLPPTCALNDQDCIYSKGFTNLGTLTVFQI